MPEYGLFISTRCLSCGGWLERLNHVEHHGTEAIAVMQCVECGKGWTVETHLRGLRTPA